MEDWTREDYIADLRSYVYDNTVYDAIDHYGNWHKLEKEDLKLKELRKQYDGAQRELVNYLFKKYGVER